MPTKSRKFSNVLKTASNQRIIIFSILIIGALIAFEIFNYSTTEFAMTDLLGDLSFGGMRWATILALAFCGIDFAGIARLFTPEQGAGEPKEVWYLLGAWLLAATMNAALTWWGVSIAILQHNSLGNAVISRENLLKAVPVFVALMVWLSRVLIIGTFSVAGERLFWSAEQTTSTRSSYPSSSRTSRPTSSPRQTPRRTTYKRRPAQTRSPQPSYSSFKPAPKPNEQTYSESPMMAKSQSSSESRRYY